MASGALIPPTFVAGRVGALAVFREPPRRHEVKGAEGDTVYVRWLFGPDHMPISFVARKNDVLDEPKSISGKRIYIRELTPDAAVELADYDARLERARLEFQDASRARQTFLESAAKRGKRVRVGSTTKGPKP